MAPQIVISLFDFTGNMVAPWADAGYLCYCVDLRHRPGEHREENIIRVGADVRDWLPPYADVKIVFAFPPCTHTAVSGARWFRDKGLGGLIESLELFKAGVRIAEWSKAPYMIENPVSTVSTYWRKPDFVFDPCEYGGYLSPHGDAYTKKTCLWTGSGFACPHQNQSSLLRAAGCTGTNHQRAAAFSALKPPRDSPERYSRQITG